MNSLHGINSTTADVSGHQPNLNSPPGSPLFDTLNFHINNRVNATSSNPEGIILKVDEEQGENGNKTENKRIDAGWTYFGQFLSHDLTTGREFGISKPRLHLDCIYGFGPKSSAYLYEMDWNPIDKYAFRGVRFLLDPYINPNGDKVNDVFRTGPHSNLPIMADVRNDENFLISQLHCAFLRFHNRMAEFFSSQIHDQDKLFNRTRQYVTRTYQWLIVNKYLQLLTGNLAGDLVKSKQPYKILDHNNRFNQEPVLMPEFIVAALRMGHSQIRSFYKINQNGRVNLFSKDREKPDLKGFKRDLRRGPVDWRFLFNFGDHLKPDVVKSRPIDLMLTSPLFDLPFFNLHDGQRNLSQTNINRSVEHNMILREEDLKVIIDKMGINTFEHFDVALSLLYPEKPIWSEWQSCKESLLKLDGWPLWIFILLEARLLGTNQRRLGNVEQQLGPLGAQIVAEQIIWILKKDDSSYLNDDISWNPLKSLGGKYLPLDKDNPEEFTIADLLYISENGIYD